MDFSCPTCNVSLEKQTLGDVRLRKCASCSGLVISIPTVRKRLDEKAFKKIWQQLYSGNTDTGRPCPGCKKPLSVVEADAEDGVIMIDVCRSCQILWFDDQEFSSLPKVATREKPGVLPEESSKKRPESRLLTPEELTLAAFREEQYQRRSFLLKLLDGSVSKELGLDGFFKKSADG